MASEADIEVSAGDDNIFEVSVQDQNGDPKTLVGAQAIRWWVARKVTSSARVIEKALASGITVTDPAGGVLQIAIDADDTEGLKGDYYHELEVVDSSGKVQTVLIGTVTVVRTLITNL